jgi:hypothetical protein
VGRGRSPGGRRRIPRARELSACPALSPRASSHLCAAGRSTPSPSCFACHLSPCPGERKFAARLRLGRLRDMDVAVVRRGGASLIGSVTPIQSAVLLPCPRETKGAGQSRPASYPPVCSGRPPAAGNTDGQRHHGGGARVGDQAATPFLSPGQGERWPERAGEGVLPRAAQRREDAAVGFTSSRMRRVASASSSTRCCFACPGASCSSRPPK